MTTGFAPDAAGSMPAAHIDTPHMDSLIGKLAEFGRLLATAELDQSAARTALLGSVLGALPAISWASFTSLASAHHKPVTLAASAETAELADGLQYRLGAGPCLQAVADTSTVRADSLADEQRWVPFVAAVLADTPVRAAISCSLAAGGHPQISLNLYAAEPLPAEQPDPDQLAVVAGACAIGLTAIEQRYRADHLERALASSRQIGAAMGILMARQRITEEQAFDSLRTASQHNHRKLREVAEEVLLTGELPKTPVPSRATDGGAARPAATGRSV